MSLKVKFSIYLSLIIVLLISFFGIFLVIVRTQEVEQDLLIRDKLISERLIPQISNDVSANYAFEFNTYSNVIKGFLQEFPDIVHFQIINPEGSIVVDSTEVTTGKYNGEKTRFITDKHILAIIGSQKIYQDIVKYNGEDTIRFFIPSINEFQTYDFSMEFNFSLQSVHQAVTNTITFLFFLCLISITIGVLLSLFLIKRLTKPLIALADIAKKVSAGNLSIRANNFPKDEVGQLAETFNHMLDAIKKSHEHLEEKIQERTKQLEASNKDLEAFSYSVSHDLRAPLRAIDGFSQMLKDGYAKKLDKNGKGIIDTIRGSTKKMSTLIDDILAFSRLGRQAITLEYIDMSALVKEVYAELLVANPNRNITFTCEKLPHAKGDRALLRQVWVNFLSNAVKYTKKKEKAVISVQSTSDKDTTIYSVKDNGAGFDMKYVGKLFGVFQRLHSSSDFEGTGIGLSIVARIIEKHNGKVWAEGVVDQGSIFSFSLPK